MSVSACDLSLNNTGIGCNPLIRAADSFIFVPFYDSVGNINELDLSSGLFDQTFFDDLINETDPFKRLYPTPQMKNIQNERGEPLMEDFDDGAKAFISQGSRSVTGMIIGKNAPPQLEGKINDMRKSGADIGVFIRDKEKALTGMKGSVSTKLRPIKIDQETLYAIFVFTTDKTIQKLMMSFMFSIEEQDKNLRTLSADQMDYDITLLRGLLDITSEYSNKTTTTVKVKLITEFGTVLDPLLDKGLVAGDFALYNVTDAAAVVITVFTEDAAPDQGNYNLTFAAQTSTDVMRITPTKNGRDYTAVVANTWIIP